MYFIFKHFLSISINRLFINSIVCSNPVFYLLSKLSTIFFFFILAASERSLLVKFRQSFHFLFFGVREDQEYCDILISDSSWCF